MIPLRNITINDLLTESSARFPERPAIETDHSVISYAALEKKTARMAAAFLAAGVSRGTHVAVWTDLSEESLLVFLTLQRIGAVAVMIHAGVPLDSLQRMITQTDASWIITDAGRHMQEAAVLYRGKHIEKHVDLRVSSDGVLSLEDLMNKANEISQNALYSAFSAVKPEDSAVMLTTSGTTGVPKVVVTSHYSRVNNGIQQASDLKATEKDRFCVVLPMFHCFCLSANIYAALAAGACLFLPEDRHTANIIHSFRDRKCTILNAVPTQFRSIIENKNLRDGDFDTLRTGIIGGGGYPPALFETIEKS